MTSTQSLTSLDMMPLVNNKKKMSLCNAPLLDLKYRHVL